MNTISFLALTRRLCPDRWIYYWQYGSRDQKALKIFVAVILWVIHFRFRPTRLHCFVSLLDALHTTLCIYSIYWYLVLNFGNVEILDTSVWSMNFQVDVNTLIDYMVHLYYARRVYIVGGSIVIPIIIVIFATACFGKRSCGFLGVYDYLPSHRYSPRTRIHHQSVCVIYSLASFKYLKPVVRTALKFWSHYTSLIPVTCIGLGSAVVADILIAVSMCWFLYHKRTGFARTDSVILTLMTYSVHSGALTSVLACAVLISFSVAPSTMYSGLFFWPMAKFYANALLAMLNSRDYVRDRPSTDNTPDNVFGLSSIRIEQRSEGDKSRRSAVSVTVHPSAATNFPQGKRDHDVESNMVESSKLEASVPSEIHHDGRMSDCSIRGDP
ncbi:hypothetical protein EDB86DRAFT_3099080 [Lactarius hatsudake]|nr:hypothetical protein EDB86DRAFT_3099080 [Lactarius hatsudake]